jgi:predicted lipoprotein
MPRIAVAAIFVALAAAITWRYPLFHVVSLKKTTEAANSAAFNAEKVASTFWEEKLTPALSAAPDAAEVVAAFKADPAAARKTFGRSVGISRSTLLLVRGGGTVTAIEDGRIGVALGAEPTDDKAAPDLWLTTDPIFNNAVRDSTGLIRSQDFPNSQHFNQLAAALNAIVEERVVPPLRKAAASGKQIGFAACAELRGGTVKLPLTLIPLEATVLESTVEP